MSTLLFELGTEELPALQLPQLSQALAEGLQARLSQAGIHADSVKTYATPRRLAVVLHQIDRRQPDQTIEKRGPSVEVGIKDGQPTPAGLGFARANQVEFDALKRHATSQGEYLLFEQVQAGQNLQDVLPDILQQVIQALPIPKRMRWGAGDAQFLRPVQWVVCLLDEEVIPVSVLAHTADRITYGHRFMAPAAIQLQHADDYANALEQAFVIADPEQRKQRIIDQINTLAGDKTARLEARQALLEEVNGLVEWPVAILCEFDHRFLDVPHEALIETMQTNQKYFPLFKDRLIPEFITIANIDSPKPELIKSGNERVVRPRLSDAEFFWQQDRKRSLDSFNERLSSVVFQKSLGSVADKVNRVIQLSRTIAELIGADSEATRSAATYCKADLMSEMVGEFPKLQGIMGGYYAKAAGFSAVVAEAIEQHYWPRFNGDALPTQAVSQAVALADKLDTLVGIFAVGLKPTGMKDPFALRRNTLGIIRIITQHQLTMSLQTLIETALTLIQADIATQTTAEADTVIEVMAFIQARLKTELDSQYTVQQINAVLARQPDDLTDSICRLSALKQFVATDAALDLAAANKRVRNILKKQAPALLDSDSVQVQQSLLQAPAEQQLDNALDQVLQTVNQQIQNKDYQAALTSLAELRMVINVFFDQVMVMVDDSVLRDNRLQLLAKMNQALSSVADLSQLQ